MVDLRVAQIQRVSQVKDDRRGRVGIRHACHTTSSPPGNSTAKTNAIGKLSRAAQNFPPETLPGRARPCTKRMPTDCQRSRATAARPAAGVYPCRSVRATQTMASVDFVRSQSCEMRAVSQMWRVLKRVDALRSESNVLAIVHPSLARYLQRERCTICDETTAYVTIPVEE